MNRGVLSGPLLLYWTGNQKAEGEYSVNTWTDIPAEIFHPVSQQVNVWKRIRVKVKEGEVLRDRVIKEIMIQSTLQYGTSVQS